MVWMLDFQYSGAVAQLVERSVRNAEVEGSTPFCSTGENLEKTREKPGFFRFYLLLVQSLEVSQNRWYSQNLTQEMTQEISP